MKIDARAPEGNSFYIMRMVRKLLTESGREKDWPEAQERMMPGNYDNLCKVAEEVTFGSIQVVNRVNEPEEDEN